MTDQDRALSFGRDAPAYDAHRPDYPDAAISYVLELAHPQRAVEVGAGTGIATQKVARDTLDLLCLEPSAPMADMLRTRSLPGVSVVEERFEDWDERSEPFDLVFSAQAWHWVDRARGMPKARSILRHDGAFALIWNVPTDRFAGLDEVYRAHAPELTTDRDERIKRRDGHDWREDMSAAGFRDTSLHTERWEREMDAAAYRNLCSTYSDHILLDPERRARLFDAIQEAIVELGGSVTLEYMTRVYSGRR